jgi:hypothetical protein
MTARTLMIGCAAGESHLHGADEVRRDLQAQLLVKAIPAHAARLGARLVPRPLDRQDGLPPSKTETTKPVSPRDAMGRLDVLYHDVSAEARRLRATP